MQYNFPHFTIGRDDFIKGSNSHASYPDGGFQVGFPGYNTFKKPGWLTNSPGLGTVVTSSLPTNPAIAWGYGKGVIAQEIMVTSANDNQDGTFWSVGSLGGLTQIGSADTGHDYQRGFTWTVYYHGDFYTTSKTDITKNSTDLATRDTSWWTTTNSNATLNSFSPHPQVVYGDIHYIADGRFIHQNDNGTTQAEVFDLGQDWVITDMTVYNNLIYIAAEPYFNFSGTNTGFSKLFTWNGYSGHWIDEWEIGPHISALKVFKNVLYVWTPNYVGYWTGSQIKNLRPYSSSSFCYSSGITTTEDSMYYADGETIIRYGSPVPKVSPRFFEWALASANVNSIGQYGTDKIEVVTTGTVNGSNYIFDSNGDGSGNNTFKLNTRRFSSPVRIRGYVFHTDGIASGTYAELSYFDSEGNLKGTKRFGYSTLTAMQLRKTWRFDVLGEPPTLSFDPYLILAGSVYVKSIDVLYEPSEDKLNE